MERKKKKTRPIIYTAEKVTKELHEITEEILNDKDIIYLGQVFEHRKYSMQRFSEWAVKFKDNEGISESIKRVKDILMSRINLGGLTGQLNPTMTIFNLKNNYGWQDKTEQTVKQESTIKHEVSPELQEMIKP